MAVPRRRYHGNHYHSRIQSLLPLISALSATLLVCVGLYTFIVPFPRHPDQSAISRRFSMRNEDENDDSELTGPPVFNVPSMGAKSSRDLWRSRNARMFYGCSEPSTKFLKGAAISYPNRYLLIATSGGLNQQRTGITDAVVAARILNATLVIPKLDQKSFWKDSSSFAEIFDAESFVSLLKNDVKIIKELPKKGGKPWLTRSMRVPRKCSEKCYLNRVLPVLVKRHAIQLSKFDYRLANKLDSQLQKLRCRVNYHALKFTSSIRLMGEKLVQRMRSKSKHFIALHLRFEPDMLAFSGCYYGGGDRERQELGAIRKRWKNLHASNPDKERRHGKCPLTPKEVGLMLRALGYDNDVHIYVASGEVYRGEEILAPFKELFPNFYTKETLATTEELEPFSTFSSRMAALDFIVCDESDVFVTNNNGNMAKILAGRRRYFGHKPTIRPNAKKLYRLFSNQGNLTWEFFSSKVRSYQRGFMGEPKEVRPGRGEFHENPHTCICEYPEANSTKGSSMEEYKRNYSLTGGSNLDDLSTDDDQELPDPDNDWDQNGVRDTISQVDDLEYDAVTSDEPDLDDLLSD